MGTPLAFEYVLNLFLGSFGVASRKVESGMDYREHWRGQYRDSFPDPLQVLRLGHSFPVDPNHNLSINSALLLDLGSVTLSV